MGEQTGISKIQLPELFDELLTWSQKKYAEYLYFKCLRNNHPKIAEKIKSKYHIKEEQSDIVMAFMYASYAAQNHKL